MLIMDRIQYRVPTSNSNMQRERINSNVKPHLDDAIMHKDMFCGKKDIIY